jgi:hypothetical protein
LRKRAKQGLGALGRWAAGGAITAKSVEEELEEAKATTIRAHRESIIWTLQNQLEECGRFQSGMMEIRLMREVEKSKSVLYKTRGTAPAMNDYNGINGGQHAGGLPADYRGSTTHRQDESDIVIENQLDPEQLQLFAQENQDMLKQYEDQLDKVRYVAVPQAITSYSCGQGNGEVAHGDLGATVDPCKQPQHTVGAYRSARRGLVQYHGECRERKQGAQAGDGAREHGTKGLLGYMCFLRDACFVGSIHMK